MPIGAVDLPGVCLWFTDTGGSGVPVVLLHANTGTSANWESQNAAFAQAGYRVIAFDRRGWGRSTADPSSGTQPGTTAEDLHALMEHLELTLFHLVGVAGGGFVALDYAAWHPERLRSLVVAASIGSVSEQEFTDMNARIRPPGFSALPPEFREMSASYRAINPEGTRRWLDIEESAQQKGAPSQPLRSPNTYAKLEAIIMPTFVLAADADLIAPPSLMRVWAAHVKNSQFDVVPEAGHSIAWEQPELFNRLVLEFIAKH